MELNSTAIFYQRLVLFLHQTQTAEASSATRNSAPISENMCNHKRFVFKQCFHYSWGPVVQKCKQEKAFDAGLVDEGCSIMVSHALWTRRMDMMCNKCAKNKGETDTKFAKARELLATIEAELSKRLKRRVLEAPETSSTPEQEPSVDSEAEAETTSPEPMDEFTDPDETLITPEEVSSFLEDKFPMVSLTMDIF